MAGRPLPAGEVAQREAREIAQRGDCRGESQTFGSSARARPVLDHDLAALAQADPSSM